MVGKLPVTPPQYSFFARLSKFTTAALVHLCNLACARNSNQLPATILTIKGVLHSKRRRIFSRQDTGTNFAKNGLTRPVNFKMVVFSSKKKKPNPRDTPNTQPIAPQISPRSNVSGNLQNPGSDNIEDLLVARPATYSRPSMELTMAIQSGSKAIGNPNVDGKIPRKLQNS